MTIITVKPRTPKKKPAAKQPPVPTTRIVTYVSKKERAAIAKYERLTGRTIEAKDRVRTMKLVKTDDEGAQ